MLASWGVDGHNSHTNVCSSGGRTGFQFWMGIDRPSPDDAHAKVIYLISAHLESGHYFNPHAQRITQARENGAKVIVLDTRLSNTATHADYGLSPQPGSEAAINLAIANYLIQAKAYDRDFVRRWWNWAEYLTACHPGTPVTFEAFEEVLAGLYAGFTFGFAAADPASTRLPGPGRRRGRGGRDPLSCHSSRSAAAATSAGGRCRHAVPHLRAARCRRDARGHVPDAWNKSCRGRPRPAHPGVWQELSWPLEYPLAQNEMSFLLPHFLAEGRGLWNTRLRCCTTRCDQPRRAELDGGPVRRGQDRLLRRADADLERVGLVRRLRAAHGDGPERHDTHSYEQYDGQWVGFRQPVLRAARSRLGEPVTDTRQVNPGEVWEENEFWIEKLSWRIDPDGSLGIRQYHESRANPGTRLTVDEYYGWMFTNSVPGLPERAAAEGYDPAGVDAPLRRVRDHPRPGCRARPGGAARGAFRRQRRPAGRVHSAAAAPGPNIVPVGAPAPDEAGRRAAGVMVDGVVRRGFPTPSGGWSSGPRRWPRGAGRSTRCPATSAATCTPRGWPRTRWCCCRRSVCRRRSTPGRRTPSGWTSSRTWATWSASTG